MRRWTKQEVERLKSIYPDTDNEELCTIFNRSIQAIRDKAYKLKLKKQTIGANPIVGKRYNSWRIKTDTIKRKNGQIYWYCECKCGRQQYIQYCYLTAGHVSQCRKCVGQAQRNPRFKNILNIANRSASLRDIEFKISKKYIEDLFYEQDGKCALTGLDLILAHAHTEKHLRTASIDRIDSSLGYIKGNIQWVHKTVNKMKLNIKQDEFIDFCCMVAKLRGI